MIDYTCFYCGRFIDGLIGKVYKHGDDAVCEDCEKKYHEGAKNTEQQVQPDSEHKQGTYDNPVDAIEADAPRELT